MHDRRIPEWLRHAPAPSVRGFAVLAGSEAISRGVLVSVMPLLMYRTLPDERIVSEVYFLIGCASLLLGLLVPYLIRFVPRRWVFSGGTLLYVAGALLATVGSPAWINLTGDDGAEVCRLPERYRGRTAA